MSKQILIDSYFGLVRTAIAEGSSLVDYYEESTEQGRSKGNIYRGLVKKVDAPIQAAFIRFGGGRDGFLPLRDAGSGNKAPKVGDTVLVQVVKDEVGDKGAALTTKLSLSGRYLVYIPERESEGGISSRISDEERAALKKALAELQIPEGGSVILRTAAMNKGSAELQADLDRLTDTYREIADKFEKGKEPGLLFRDVPPALRYLREYYAPDVERIWVNQEEVLDQCRQFFYLYEPRSAAKVVLSKDGPLMFQKLGLEGDVEKLNSRKVGLPSGANIVIDQAEALVAIDVNSAKAGGRGEESKGRSEGKGKTDNAKGRDKRGSDLEETVFAVNREAAGEIARQLRLRDLGGIIIVDFIDMEEEKHRRQIEDIMRKAMAADKAKVKIYDISPLGIMQISRQRLRKAGPHFSRQGCEACQGRGWHPSATVGAMTALRKVEERLHGKRAGQSLVVNAPYPIANKLLNEFREHVLSMEKRFGCTLRVIAQPSHSGDAAIASQSVSGEDGQPREAAAPAERASGERRRPEGRGRAEARVKAETTEAVEAIEVKDGGETREATVGSGKGDGRGRAPQRRGAKRERKMETPIPMEARFEPESGYTGPEPVAMPEALEPGAVGIIGSDSIPDLVPAGPETGNVEAPADAGTPGGKGSTGRRGGGRRPPRGKGRDVPEGNRREPGENRVPQGAANADRGQSGRQSRPEGTRSRIAEPAARNRPQPQEEARNAQARNAATPRNQQEPRNPPQPRNAPVRIGPARPPAVTQESEGAVDQVGAPRRRSRRRSRRGKGGGANENVRTGAAKEQKEKPPEPASVPRKRITY